MSFKTENKNIELQRAIVRTVAYFDMFDFPLTDFEIWKFVNLKCNLLDAQRALKKLSPEASELSFLQSKNGFYFLKGRSEIIDKRLKKYAYTDRKFKRAMRIAKIFKFIPWIKMIAISNIIGAHNLRDESDIDFFIITKTKKIWLTRFFCSSVAQTLGLRPKKGDERDKVCLNFYVGEEAMNIKNLMLGTEQCSVRKNSDDIYFKYWLINLVPIYDAGNTYKNFIRENNWIKNYFPNWRLVQTERRRYFKKGFSLFNVLNLFNGLESVFKKLQLRLMPKNMKKLMNKDTRVVINNNVLKMHVNDRRSEYNERFSNKLEEIIKNS